MKYQVDEELLNDLHRESMKAIKWLQEDVLDFIEPRDYIDEVRQKYIQLLKDDFKSKGLYERKINSIAKNLVNSTILQAIESSQKPRT